MIALPDHIGDIDAARKADLELSTDSRAKSDMYGAFGVGGRRSKPGGGDAGQASNKVVVDVREFRSSLPSLLHASGFELVPRTIAVADFILAPEICIGNGSAIVLYFHVV